MGAKTQRNTYPPLPASEQITGSEKISKFLRRFTKHYTPLTVKIPNHKQRYTSCIVSVENEHGEKIKGELHNLSYGGAGMILLPDKTIMEKGTLHECAIELPEEEWIYCTVKLHFSKNIPSRNTQIIDTQFVKLSAMQSRLIGRCISALERELIRKRAAY